MQCSKSLSSILMHIVLKQHTDIVYSIKITDNKRRKNMVYIAISKSKFILTNRYHTCLGKNIYSKVNKTISIYDVNYLKFKQLVRKYLQTLSFDQTEELPNTLK